MSDLSIACIAFMDNKILIARRIPVGDMGNRWEFPGGKAEEGECDEMTVMREIHEEFGVEAGAVEKICEVEFDHDGKKSVLRAWEVILTADGIEMPYALKEHSEYRWVELDDLETKFADNFVDSDLRLVPDVKKFLKEKYNV